MDYCNILLDTSIGNKIESFLGLSYLLTQENCKLHGITIVGNDIVNRGKIASTVCRVSGKQIPVYLGSTPKLPNEWCEAPINTDKLTNYSHPESFEGNYVDYMYSVLKSHPYAVSIICTGPLTNIAKLIEIYPNTTAFIKELKIIGCVFDEKLNNSNEMPFINSNIWSDPESARKVFNSNIQSIKIYSHEVCSKLTIPKEEFIKRCNNNILKCSVDLSNDFDLLTHISFHNAAPVLATLYENLFLYKKGKIEIDTSVTENNPLYGSTTFIEDNTSNIEVCTLIDSNLFLEKYFESFNI